MKRFLIKLMNEAITEAENERMNWKNKLVSCNKSDCEKNQITNPFSDVVMP